MDKGLSIGPASIAFVEFREVSVVTMNAFRSRKAMVRYLVSERPLDGEWASDEHLAALEEAAELLAMTIHSVKMARLGP